MISQIRTYIFIDIIIIIIITTFIFSSNFSGKKMTECCEILALPEVESKDDIEGELQEKLEETINNEDLLCSTSQSEAINASQGSPPPKPKIVLQEVEADNVISEIEINIREPEEQKEELAGSECDVLCEETEAGTLAESPPVETSNIEAGSQSGNLQERMAEQETEPQTPQGEETTSDQEQLSNMEEEKRKKEEEEEAEKKRKEEEEEEQKRLADEAEKRKREEEVERKRVEEEKRLEEERRKQEEKRRLEEEQRQKAVEEARRAEELSAKKAAEETAAAAKLEKFDSFDVIGCLVDRENQELSRTKRETERLLTGPEAAELGKDLWEAASQGKAGAVRMLLQAGADPNFSLRTGLMSTSSPLVTAACRGHTEVVSCLLDHPATEVNGPVSGGWTALMWAAWYGHTEVVTQLLAVNNINKDQLNQAGKNAVMYAAEAGRVETCRVLLDGVEKFEANEEDRAVRKNRLDKLLDQALKAGCDVPLAKMVLGNKTSLQYLVLRIENIR